MIRIRIEVQRKEHALVDEELLGASALGHAGQLLHDGGMLAGVDGSCREVAMRERVHCDCLLRMLLAHVFQDLQHQPSCLRPCFLQQPV